MTDVQDERLTHLMAIMDHRALTKAEQQELWVLVELWEEEEFQREQRQWKAQINNYVDSGY